MNTVRRQGVLAGAAIERLVDDAHAAGAERGAQLEAIREQPSPSGRSLPITIGVGGAHRIDCITRAR